MAILAPNPEPVARDLAGQYGCPTVAVSVADGASAGSLAAVLAGMVREAGAQWVCLGHTPFSADLAPALAVLAGGCCVPGVEAVERGEGGPVFSRSVAGGRLIQKISPLAFPAVLTVLGGSQTPPEESVGPAGEVVFREAGAAPEGIRSLGVLRRTGQEPGLADAEAVVAVGRGMGCEENLGAARRLAALFPRGVLAGSRPACDLGWLPHRCQVGITGATVAPALYLACGISGAFQHVAGMRGSRFVVAVNRDENAPIFHVADLGVKEDAVNFLPLLAQACEKRRKEGGS